MEIKDHETEFVIRTQDILQNYHVEYRLTNAINCMLGLIILPNEMLARSQSPMWDALMVDIQELSFLRVKLFEPIRGVRNGVTEYFPKSLKIFLKKIRNGLAHQKITPINIDRLFTGVMIINYHGRDLDLEVEFNRQELEQFAVFVAGEYLRV